MSKKAWIIFAAVCVVVLAALVYFSNKDKVSVDSINVLQKQPAVAASGNIGDHIFGQKNSKITLIEYGDYQCPGCGSAYPKLKAVTEKYKGQLTFVFRNFPLTTLHPNAKAAAAAAEAAGLQGKYWEMHNMLYEGQDSWKDLSAGERTDFFVGYAKTLGLNADTFKKDMNSSAVNQKISFDLAVGKKAGVTGTPTIYLNGKSIESNVWSDQEQLDAAVANALQAVGIKLPDDAKN